MSSKRADVFFDGLSRTGRAITFAAVAGLLVWRLIELSRKSSEGKQAGEEGQILQEMAASKSLSLSHYEKMLEGSLISRDKLGSGVGFGTIGGLERQIAAIEDLVILPLSRPDLFAHSKVSTTPSGVLLYGPPGTGKTLLAKAIAKEAKASFISLNVATIENKWYGETPKLIDALFSLARKVAPTVIFCDEIDGFLGTRHDLDQQHTSLMKTKFMENWDGLLSSVGDDKKQWVLVVGATNKPWTIDPAVQRRMPRQIEVPLPDAEARVSILQVLLSGERVSEDIDIAAIADAAEGYSGSDLKEVVRAASMIPIREALQAERAAARAAAISTTTADPASANAESKAGPRPISDEDFRSALGTIKPNGAQAREYQQQAMRSGTNWGTRGSNAFAVPSASGAGAGAATGAASVAASSAAGGTASGAAGGATRAPAGGAARGAAGGATVGQSTPATPAGPSLPSDASLREAAEAIIRMLGHSAEASSLNER